MSGAGGQVDGGHDAYSALRGGDYRLFAAGFVCSSMGLQMLTTAVGWEVYARSGRMIDLGYVGLARALPVVLLALLAGHVVDTRDRRMLVVVTQVGFAVVAAGLAVASFAGAPLVVFYVLLFASGCVRSFNGPARNALLPQIVGVGAFENAVTWTTGMFQFSAVAGPLAAGVVIDATGGAWGVYAAMSVLCLVFAVCAVFLRPRKQVVSAKGLSVASLLGGLAFLGREKTVLGALLLDLFAVLLGSATALLPVYVKDVLGVEAGWQGTAQGMLRSSLFVGALVMAVVMAHRPPLRRAGVALLGCVALFGVCTIGFGLSTSVWVAAGFLFAAGAADQVSVVVRHVLVQVRTPEELRGRVGAVNSLFIECSNELGAFESGLVASWFGPVVSVVSGGVGTVLVVGVLALALPQLRRLGRLVEGG